jgi:hypothetical protein
MFLIPPVPLQVLGIHFLWIVVACSIVMMTGQIALSTTSGEEWLLIEEEQVSRYDALNEAWDKVPDASVGDTELPRTEVHDKGTTTFVYIAEQSGNMLTPEGLAVMKQVR